MPMWDALRVGVIQVVTSELTMLEVSVKPMQTQNSSLHRLFLRVLYRTKGLTCAPITRQILAAAARIRAHHGLKTPDAIHAATALDHGCTLFVTNDPAFRRVTGLDVAILSEVAAT
jgi:predicted nucleic acid-binding protein